MTARLWFGMAAVALAAVGCDASLFDSSLPTGGRAAQDGAPGGFSIFLCAFDGPDHIRQAAECKRKTEGVTHWKGIYVVHEARWSCLYLGRYATELDAGEDLKKVRQWRAPSGMFTFAHAYIQKRAEERVGPPEWDLANVTDPEMRYTVVIGQFHNLPEQGFTTRKEMAVANCRELRQEGKDAYYHHGPEKSFVTIGLFPQQAFWMEKLGDGGVRAVIVDQKMNAIMKERPWLAVNGYECKVKAVNPVTGKHEDLITSTYVTSLSEFRGGKVGRPDVGAGQPQPR